MEVKNARFTYLCFNTRNKSYAHIRLSIHLFTFSQIGSDGLVTSLLILVGMIVLVIGSIHCQGWRLTKVLGGMMFVLYIAFVVQAVVLALPLTVCSE